MYNPDLRVIIGAMILICVISIISISQQHEIKSEIKEEPVKKQFEQNIISPQCSGHVTIPIKHKGITYYYRTDKTCDI